MVVRLLYFVIDVSVMAERYASRKDVCEGLQVLSISIWYE